MASAGNWISISVLLIIASVNQRRFELPLRPPFFFWLWRKVTTKVSVNGADVPFIQIWRSHEFNVLSQILMDCVWLANFLSYCCSLTEIVYLITGAVVKQYYWLSVWLQAYCVSWKPKPWGFTLEKRNILGLY